MTKQEKRALIDRYISAYNAFDVEGMMATLHPDIAFKNVSGGEVNATATGAEAFRQMAEQATTLFASRQQTITAFEADENRAHIDIAYEGVLAVDLPNGMKAGDVLKLEGRSEFAFLDGKISQVADYS